MSIPKTWRKQMDKKLDDLAGECAMIRDKRANGGLCVICDRRPIQVPYHIYSRSYWGIRWDLDNIVGSCAPCNYGEKQNRNMPGNHIDKIWVPRRGEHRMHELKRRATEHIKHERADLLTIQENLNRFLERVLL